MILSKPKIYNEKNKVRFEVNVDSDSGSHPLWYEVDKEYGAFISGQSDAALLALLIPAMNAGEDIVVKGELSNNIYFIVKYRIQNMLSIVMPWLSKVDISCDSLIFNEQDIHNDVVATGFSCGVDSYSVLADYYYSNIEEEFRVTHLLFNNVGSHGKGGEDLFNHRYESVKRVADEIGLPIIKVNSNLDAFYSDERLSFVRTATLRNASIPLLLNNKIGRFYYGSSISYEDQGVSELTTLGYCDTIILPMLATQNINLHSIGSEYTRVEKTVSICTIDDTFSTLDVCTSSDTLNMNCSKCNKCMRTMLTMELAGRLDNYSKVFDLKIYRQRRNSYIAQILNSENPLDKEIIAFMEDKNFNVSLNTRTKSFLKSLYSAN